MTDTKLHIAVKKRNKNLLESGNFVLVYIYWSECRLKPHLNFFNLDIQMKVTFGLVVGACYLKQTEDTGHASQASISVRVLQTGHCALQ